MQKDFDKWNKIKKIIHERKEIFCNPREIWWCSIGLNIGSEEDGKNDLYERPVLIIKVFNRSMIRVIPLTSKSKNDKNHFQINYDGKIGSAILSQMKTISTKRLTRKLIRLNKTQFQKIEDEIKDNLL